MGMRIGIVGLPNVGKSTILNALTNAQKAQSTNYPFCTIEANKAIVPVPDERLRKLAAIVRSKQVIHATVEFVDIAGLVKGAHQGEGLGNQFLANIRETDAMLHVVRCFMDDDIMHVDGSVDPIRDIQTIETELLLADIQTLENRLETLAKAVKHHKAPNVLLENAKALLEHLNQGRPASSFVHRDEESMTTMYRDLRFLTAKHMIYCANVNEEGLADDSALVQELRRYASSRGRATVKIAAKVEEELIGISEEEKREFLASFGAQHSALELVIRQGYRTLGLISYFTAGPKEVRAWTIRRGWKAPKAASMIHTDFEKGFIRANVIAYRDFIRHDGEAGAKAAGLMRQEGKDYIVQEGDVILFLFNT